MVFLFEIETSRLTSSSSLRWCQTSQIVRAEAREDSEDSEDIKTVKCAMCWGVGRWGRAGSKLVSRDDLPLLHPLFHCSSDEEREQYGDSSFLSWQIQVFLPTKNWSRWATGPARCARWRQVFHPVTLRPPVSGALRCDQRWRLDGGRRRDEESCRRAPRGKCRVLH